VTEERKEPTVIAEVLERPMPLQVQPGNRRRGMNGLMDSLVEVLDAHDHQHGRFFKVADVTDELKERDPSVRERDVTECLRMLEKVYEIVKRPPSRSFTLWEWTGSLTRYVELRRLPGNGARWKDRD